MKWYLILICLDLECWIKFFIRLITLILSYFMKISLNLMLKFLSYYLIHKIWAQQLSVVMYSTSDAIDNANKFYFLLNYKIKFILKNW